MRCNTQKTNVLQVLTGILGMQKKRKANLRLSAMTLYKYGAPARLLPSRLSLSVPEFHRVSCLPPEKEKALADCTAGGDFHPALKTFYSVVRPLLYSILKELQPLIFVSVPHTASRRNDLTKAPCYSPHKSFSKPLWISGKNSLLTPSGKGDKMTVFREKDGFPHEKADHRYEYRLFCLLLFL